MMTEENIVEHETDSSLMNGEMENSLSIPSLNMVLTTSTDSIVDRQICNVVRKHFLEQRPIGWRPVKVDLVVNTELTEDFLRIQKRFEKLADGNQAEFKETYAFLIDNDDRIIDICHHGYQCTETSFNVLGHSKGGVYVCKYADVCIRQANTRRTTEGNMTMKLLVFKIVAGKQTAALVRKGSKLQPIAPTPLFTSHSSVITPKETDDLERQFDQSQIFLYQFEGRETVKRPAHCLPYAVVSLIQDGTLWPTSFDNLDMDLDMLDADVLRVIAQSDDSQLQDKLKENIELMKNGQNTVEHTFQDEAPSSLVDKSSLSFSNSEATPITASDNTTSNSTLINATEVSSSSSSSSSSITSNDPISTTSPAPLIASISNLETPPNSTIPPPPPPPSSSSSSTPMTSPNAKTPTPTISTAIPMGHSVVSTPAAYRQQTGLLGVLPTATAVRGMSGAVYAAAPGHANGLAGQIIYGGLPLDALRGYQTANAATAPLMFATHGGQTMQQPALYAAQLSAAAQQQAAQLAAAAASAQQSQQSLINGVPAGCMVVRTANGGYALLAQAPTAAAMQSSASAALAQQQQQQYISLNAAGQPTAATARLPVAIMGGQPQQVVYQYAGQPSIQTAPTQYIQLPSNYAQQQFSANAMTSQMYASQTPTQYIGAPQPAVSNSNHSSSSNSSSMVPTSSIVGSSATIQSQTTPTLISPQKQSAASATAAALQQQQQYQHVSYAQQQQQAQQQSANGAHGANVYYAAIAQAQAQLTAQMQAQQQAATTAALTQQQQQQLGLIPQIQYAAQAGIAQPTYYTTSSGQTIYQAGGQSYILAQAAPTGGTTTTGAPAIYSAGPALHNGATQQQQQNQQQTSQSQAQQQQIAYQIAAAAAAGQPTAAGYQLLSAASTGNLTGQQQATLGAGVVAQQPAQLVQRSSVMSQVRHHPYRS